MLSKISRFFKPDFHNISPRKFKLITFLYPPFFGAGIRVVKVKNDFTAVRVKLKYHFWNRNALGTAFGGSMLSMTDPFFLLMLMKILGNKYVIWDYAAKISFLKPGRSALICDMKITPADLEIITTKAADGEKVLHWFTADIVDKSGNIIAQVHRQVYVRLAKI